jgi:hypothetical protein
VRGPGDHCAQVGLAQHAEIRGTSPFCR